MNPKYWIIKQILDRKGPGFCLEKWGTSTLHLSTGQEHGCHHCGPVKIDPSELENPAALFNHSHKQTVRQEMLDGKIPQECSYCHLSTGIQDRIIQSGYTYNWFNPHANSTASHPRSLEVSFSTVCNLACSYCGPTFSSKWQSEIEVQGEYPNGYNKIHIKPILEREHNPYTEAFWKYWKIIHPNLKQLRITGGEPLLSKHTFTLIEEAKNIPLTINTNLAVDDHFIDRFIDTIRHKRNITVATSGEAQGSKAEYSRHGLKYNQFLRNLARLKEECPHVKLHIMSTYNVLCVSSFTDFLKDVKQVDNKISLHVSRLTQPSFLTHKLITDYKKESLEYIKKNFSTNTVKRFENVFFDDTYTDMLSERDKFKSFIAEYDKRRGLDFSTVFPEYKFLIE
jgi:organic radical activating enzyme